MKKDNIPIINSDFSNNALQPYSRNILTEPYYSSYFNNLKILKKMIKKRKYQQNQI